MHALLAGVKAYSTQVAADGAEDARKCCGGHGYLSMSGFGHLVPTVTAIATLEGENYVMYQQMARFLVKCINRAGAHATTAYLLSRDADRLPLNANLLDPQVQLQIFRHRSQRLVVEFAQALEESQKDHGMTFAQAWNKSMLESVSTARAHLESVVLATFIDVINSVEPGPVRTALQRLCSLYALSSIDGPNGIEFLADGYITAAHLQKIREEVDGLLQALLPDSIALTDAWDFTDASLASALGSRDGDVYERIMEWTRQVPLNVEAQKMGGVYKPAFEQIIRPILNGKL